jgi:hypothetical protein
MKSSIKIKIAAAIGAMMFSVILLCVSPMLAEVSGRTPRETAMEVAFAVPSIIFTFAGVAGVVGGAIYLIVLACTYEDAEP